MTSSIPVNPTQTCAAPVKNWVHQNPKLATVTAVAFAALGIAIGGAIYMTASISLAVILGLAAALSLGTSITLGFFLSQRPSLRDAVAQLDDGGALHNNLQAITQQLGILRMNETLMNETLGCLRAGSYTSPDGQNHALEHTAAVRGTTLFLSGGAVSQRPGNEPTRIILKDQDCLYAAADLHARGLNPCVLDMANGHHFGGGYMHGARAQEEDCCRRSTLSIAVDTQHGQQTRNFYPLANHSATAGLYVPMVNVFRAGHDRGYQMLNQPFNVGFGIIDAINAPPLDHSTGSLRLQPREANITREKIRTFFEMARQSGHQSVVFGALGCGAFGNPPDHIAEMALDVIQQEFAHCFREVVIAVIDDHNTGRAHNPEGNFRPFARRVLAANGTVINANGQPVTAL